jgi:CHAT domain-containing protein
VLLWASAMHEGTDGKIQQKAVGRARPRIHWCPTGAFAFVPVHAAGIYEGSNQECCADFVVSSYTPTLTALLRAQQHSDAFSPAQARVVVIAAEDAPGSGLPPLPYVTQEAEHVIEVATKAGAVYSNLGMAARAEIIAALESAEVVHLACHGIQNSTNPHKSRFCLSSGSLTVSKLMELDLKNAFFAFLSACETAKGDQKHADEVVHLAATMLFAGFKSVVATMWCVDLSI